MDLKEICPCPNLNCPNRGYCDKCSSRHVRIGYLNYCAFQTLLPVIRQVIDDAPESATAKKMDALTEPKRSLYG